MREPKRALVTGAYQGLGRAMADQLDAQGYDVTTIDRSRMPVDAPFHHHTCDLSNRAEVDALIDVLAREDAFDVLVFNAGISATGKFEEIEPDAHARVMEVNAVAPITLCAALMANRKISDGAKIGFVSSLSHFTGYPGAASYGASKDAIAIYAKSVGKVWKKSKGISVTTAFPGPLRTEHAARHAPEGADADKRMAPAEAAKLILKDVLAGKPKSLPGGGAKVFAFVGHLAPSLITKAMRKIIYEKLDKRVED
ncbi:MAG: SDR family NAD(P)-dependent oxidoreductase [Pseudomonadota bacterium]